MNRRAAQDGARAEAQRLEAAALASLDVKSRAIFERIDAVRRAYGSDLQVRQLVYSGEVNSVLIQRGDERVFPSGEWPFPLVEDERRHKLSVAAELYSHSAPPQGWYAGLSGIVFFRCNNAQDEKVCFALDESGLRADLVSALDSVAKQAPDWAFALHDHFNRVFWSVGPGSAADSFFFPLTGAFQGWRLDVSKVSPAKANAARIVALSVPLALLWIFFISNLSRRQSEKLAQAEDKKTFLDKIAHDLRTPLANLKLFCELIAQESQGNAKAEDHCTVLSAEVDRLDQVAANAMAFCRTPTPRMRKAIPAELMQLLLGRFELRLAASNSVCTIAASETAPLLFDASAFERILVNLLDNACKYAPGAISVASRFKTGFIELEVCDDGPGLTAADVVKPSGSGLGLSIVHDLAKANGGRVSLINGQRGLRVVVTLKARPVEGDALDVTRG